MYLVYGSVSWLAAVSIPYVWSCNFDTRHNHWRPRATRPAHTLNRTRATQWHQKQVPPLKDHADNSPEFGHPRAPVFHFLNHGIHEEFNGIANMSTSAIPLRRSAWKLYERGNNILSCQPRTSKHWLVRKYQQAQHRRTGQ